jgi:hypothetical protein
MPSATSTPWITFIAAFGIGSIMAAIVGWCSAKAVAISNHRQNWINALRDDIALYLKEIDLVHYRHAKVSHGTADDLDNLQESRNAAMLVYRRILLRLNMTEQPHIDLGQQLEGLLMVTAITADSQRIGEVVTLARNVLKHEWAVTKYGIFTKPVTSFKGCWKHYVG